MSNRIEIDRVYCLLKSKYIKRHHLKKRTKKINEAADNYNIDPSILMSLYIIETYYRPFYARIFEYIILFLEWIFCNILNKPIRNYTIGPFQLGISKILFFGNIKKCDIHISSIDSLSLFQVFKIYKYCILENNLDLCCKNISIIQHNNKRKWSNSISNVGRIGQIYNGKISYGILLMKLSSFIKEYNLIL
ncbi:hypothetical protein IMX26_04065 [Clostridium sp. 'deep sea']|uniref:hypothetical protein n=1 Tax=Clostridium sp. 'deep sea' TaxID=2779445 RepID=UPI001896812E|nr:hypothetical protein [Clostridium sp. 'deep sea']QOR35999.1 hypothetical protein IMX26_04065 [Clostridium sp. 'deep sea']